MQKRIKGTKRKERIMKQISEYKYLKEYIELTDKEKNTLIIPATDNIDDYANFMVQYNKRGKLCNIRAYEFSASKRAELEEYSKKANIIDWCNVAAPKDAVNPKARKASRKRINDMLGIDEEL